MIENDPINIRKIIKHLLNRNKPFADINVRFLRPIDKVVKGWFGGYHGEAPFGFQDHIINQYFSLTINFDDDQDRVDKILKINAKIRDYNVLVTKRNKLLKDEKFKNRTSDKSSRVFNDKSIPIMGEYDPWEFLVMLHVPDMTDYYRMIKDETLYKLKEELPLEEFVTRFNKMIFEYIQVIIKERQQLRSADKTSMWDVPEKRFLDWFHGKLIDTSSISALKIYSETSEKIKDKRNDEGLTKSEKLYKELYNKTRDKIIQRKKTKAGGEISIGSVAYDVYIQYKNGTFNNVNWSKETCRRYYYIGEKLCNKPR